MDKVEYRRVAPTGWMAVIGIGLLVGFELLIMGGALELRSSTVAKYTPWAYEPFLKLVGEHPDSAIVTEESLTDEPAKDESFSGIAGVAGISSEEINLDLNLDVSEDPETIITEPGEELTDPAPDDEPKEVVPVG